jgi:hypothetical protein
VHYLKNEVVHRAAFKLVLVIGFVFAQLVLLCAYFITVEYNVRIGGCAGVSQVTRVDGHLIGDD